nr:hypothetical protein CFP56_14367 [Quercus suber]
MRMLLLSGGSCMCTSRCRAKLYHFETSTTKNLFDNCCYLYISMILVILEVVFQVFLRLLRIPQYSNQWACETGKHLHELSFLVEVTVSKRENTNSPGRDYNLGENDHVLGSPS